MIDRRPVLATAFALLLAHGARMRDFGRILAVDDYTGMSETIEFGVTSIWRVTGQGYLSLHRVGLLAVSVLDPWHWAIALFVLSVVSWWVASMGLLLLAVRSGTSLGGAILVAILPLAIPVRIVSNGDTTDVPFGLAYAHFPIAIATVCVWIALAGQLIRRRTSALTFSVGIACLISPVLGPVLLAMTILACTAIMVGLPTMRGAWVPRRLVGPTIAACLATLLQVVRWLTRNTETPADWQALMTGYSPTSHLRSISFLASLIGATKSLVLALMPEPVATSIRDHVGPHVGAVLVLCGALVALLLSILSRRRLGANPVSLGLLAGGVLFLISQSIAKDGAQVRYMIVPFVLVGAGLTLAMMRRPRRGAMAPHGPSRGLLAIGLLWSFLLVTRFEVGANSDERVRSWRGNLIVARDECQSRRDGAGVLVGVTVKQPTDVGLVATCGRIR